MNAEERYLFDLQGYLVVPNALSAGTLKTLNAALDEKIAERVDPTSGTHRFMDLLTWGQPYLDLIDQDSIMPYVEALVGNNFRLDHVYLDIIRRGLSPIGATLHGGAVPFDPTTYFRHHNGEFQNGLTVVAYNLANVNPGEGGFAAVPGSHKSNFSFPAGWKDLVDPQPCVEQVTGPAGTAVIFTEALTHGSLPWQADHERRTIFYKYSPHAVAWIAEYPEAADHEGLTDSQRAILEAPNARASNRPRAIK
jgi:hypothetical protein